MSSWSENSFGSSAISWVCFYHETIPFLISTVGNCHRPLTGLSASGSPNSSKLFSTGDLTAANLIMSGVLLRIFQWIFIAFRWKPKLCLPVQDLLYPFILSKFLHTM